MDKEPVSFSTEELYGALDKYIGKAKRPDISRNPDPGTVTRPEIEKRYGFGRSAARRYIAQLLDDGIIVRDWVNRYDEWPPHAERLRQGYRYTGKAQEDEQLDKE